jgi:phenylpyruvate tautomerase PptA (4-oxalocrotonate tautomerase family)
MPYIHVKITEDGLCKSQKEQIVKDITHSLVNTLGK